MVNVCTRCHAVTYGKSGWRVINKYNGGKLCLVCNGGMRTFKGAVDEAWLEEQKKLHDEWLKERGAA